ncbi:MAG: ribbon-helix-helix protein, CopG family [Nakamurella sp.]
MASIPREGTMMAKYTIGPDIDLDVDVVLDMDGRRITEKRAQQIAADALTKAGAGRPSLTAPGRRSPEVKARVPEDVRDRLHATAHDRGTSTSEIIREALEEYLAPKQNLRKRSESRIATAGSQVAASRRGADLCGVEIVAQRLADDLGGAGPP